MAADDPVDDEAMIFTEADVYMVAGYLSAVWGVDSNFDVTEDTERAITHVLADYLNPQRS